MVWINLFCSALAVVIAAGPLARLGLPRWAVVAAGAALVALAQQALVHRALRVSLLSPDGMPIWAEAALLWGTAFLLAAGGLSVAWWALRFCHVAVPGWIPLAAGAAAGVWLVWMGERLPPVREHEVALAGLPAEAEGLRVAVLADVHIDAWRGRAWCERLVARVNAAKPDLLVFTGDQADGAVALRREDLAPLAGLEAPEGKFLITGNHEHYFETEAYLREYGRLGMTVELRGLLAGLPEGAFPVLLVHKPGIARTADALGVRLQLSGHTHGGQVPGVAAIIARFNDGFVRGWYALPRGMRLFVSPGVGVWMGFPYRVYGPQIALLTLRGA